MVRTAKYSGGVSWVVGHPPGGLMGCGDGDVRCSEGNSEAGGLWQMLYSKLGMCLGGVFGCELGYTHRHLLTSLILGRLWCLYRKQL